MATATEGAQSEADLWFPLPASPWKEPTQGHPWLLPLLPYPGLVPWPLARGVRENRRHLTSKANQIAFWGCELEIQRHRQADLALRRDCLEGWAGGGCHRTLKPGACLRCEWSGE